MNEENDWATCLTVDQLKTMWEPAAEGKITNWNQVDPELPRRAARARGRRHGLRHVRLLHGRDQRRGGREPRRLHGVRGRQRDRPGRRRARRAALGYFGYTYYEENADSLKAVEIDGGSGCVAPSPETAQDGTYAPLSRPLFIYVNNEARARTPGSDRSSQFYLDNIDTIAEAALFIPPSDEQKAAAAEALAGALGG